MTSPTIWSAGRYESVAEHIAPIAVQVVDAADRCAPLRDAALVDLACGTGTAALAAAERGARVTAVDLTPELVALAAQKAKAAGRSVTWLTANASATGLPAQSFEAVVSNMGIIFVEPTGQVLEFERLLKPGGTLAFSSWVREPDNPFSKPVIDVLGPPPASAYSPDQWGARETILARLSNGFTDVDIDTGTHTWQFPSVEAAMTFVTRESPIHVSVFGNVDDKQRAALSAAFEQAMRARTDGAGVRLSAPYVVVTARRR